MESLVVERRFSAKDEAFYRRLILPEEDRRQYPAFEPKRSYRWFRSPNVIPIEHWQRPKPTPPYGAFAMR
jgi:hypothetical protein